MSPGAGVYEIGDIDFAANGTAFRVSDATNTITTIGTTQMIGTRTTFGNGAGASAGTLTNAPAVGNPTKWIPIDDNGTLRHIPAW